MIYVVRTSVVGKDSRNLVLKVRVRNDGFKTGRYGSHRDRRIVGGKMSRLSSFLPSIVGLVDPIDKTQDLRTVQSFRQNPTGLSSIINYTVTYLLLP